MPLECGQLPTTTLGGVLLDSCTVRHDPLTLSVDSPRDAWLANRSGSLVRSVQKDTTVITAY